VRLKRLRVNTLVTPLAVADSSIESSATGSSSVVDNNSGNSASSIPSGKGMFTQLIRRSIVNISAEEFGITARDNGITWLGIQGVGFPSSARYGTVSHEQEYIEAFKEHVPGGQIFVWGWPCANSSEAEFRAFADAICASAERYEAAGVILDIEGPNRNCSGSQGAWNARNSSMNLSQREEKMSLLLRIMRERAAGLSVGVTSFGTAVNGFPWEAMREADFGIPQLYDKDNNLFEADGSPKSNQPPAMVGREGNYVVHGINLWQSPDRFGNKPIIVALANDASGRKTAAQLRALNDLASGNLPTPAIIWWRWRNLGNGPTSCLTPEKWQLIREFSTNR